MKEAAKFLGGSTDTVYRLGKQGKLVLKKIGRNTRVTQASLDAYVKNAKRVEPKHES